MGQRTRMGRAKTGGRPISRAAYRAEAETTELTRRIDHLRLVMKGELPADNAGGRARFAAKHAAQPWVKYERTEQSNFSGEKTAPPPKPPRARGSLAVADPFMLYAMAAIRFKRGGKK